MLESANVVVVRCADLPVPSGASDVRNCRECGEPCWASKSTTELEQRFPEVNYVCQVCMPPDQVVAQHKVAVLSGQRAELEEQIGSWRATLLLHSLGAQEVDDS